ncbi:MAG: hypothetical protein K1X92_07955 [Bacteroidia bacterium]|nr:hypothetical protein [Bacteroidia bacterium]
MKTIYIIALFCGIIGAIGLLFPVADLTLNTNIPLLSGILKGKSLSLTLADIGGYAWILPVLTGIMIVFNLILIFIPVKKGSLILSVLSGLCLLSSGILIWQIYHQSQEKEFINRIMALATQYFHLDLLGIYAQIQPFPATGFWITLTGLFGALICSLVSVFKEKSTQNISE